LRPAAGDALSPQTPVTLVGGSPRADASSGQVGPALVTGRSKHFGQSPKPASDSESEPPDLLPTCAVPCAAGVAQARQHSPAKVHAAQEGQEGAKEPRNRVTAAWPDLWGLAPLASSRAPCLPGCCVCACRPDQKSCPPLHNNKTNKYSFFCFFFEDCPPPGGRRCYPFRAQPLREERVLRVLCGSASVCSRPNLRSAGVRRAFASMTKTR